MPDVYYDQYSVEINADPYPVYRRLRDEAPIYYNDTHDFFAVSRFEDVEKGLLDAQTYISGKRRDPRGDQSGHRDAPWSHHLRGSADPHHSQAPALPCVHAATRRRARAQDP